jgi:DNA-binding transcriptional LysR family regulator
MVSLTGDPIREENHMLNLLQLQLFTVAAETENFSEAARRIHLSQPAVSQQIRSLEQYLGVDLFHRPGRGVKLTDAGQILLPMARDLLDLSQQIEETMHSLEERVEGHLVIGCTTTAGKYVLPFVAAAFSQRHPDVRVTIEICRTDPVEEILLADMVHVCVSNTRLVRRDIECQPFFTDQVVLVVPANHPFANRSYIRPVELLDQPFISRERDCNTCRIVEKGLAEQGIGIDQLRMVMVVGSAEAIETAVEHGLGVAFISRMAARHGLELGRLVEVPVEGLHLARLLYAVRRSSSSKTPAQARFWDFVKEYREQIAQKFDAWLLEARRTEPVAAPPSWWTFTDR